jgi:hypothetical protein
VNGSALVGIRVAESFNLTGLTSKETVKLWADLVAFAFAEGVALSASCLWLSVLVNWLEGQSKLTLKRLAPFLASPIVQNLDQHTVDDEIGAPKMDAVFVIRGVG